MRRMVRVRGVREKGKGGGEREELTNHHNTKEEM